MSPFTGRIVPIYGKISQNMSPFTGRYCPHLQDVFGGYVPLYGTCPHLRENRRKLSVDRATYQPAERVLTAICPHLRDIAGGYVPIYGICPLYVPIYGTKRRSEASDYPAIVPKIC